MASRLKSDLSSTNLVRLAIAAALSVFFLIGLKLTWQWPFVGDAQVIHYVVFLIHHGFVPYREITDMNMPGAYLFEWWALAVFGSTNLGWRAYDLFLALTMLASMIAIARRYDWIAGLAATVIFTLTHFADGPAATGQRDQVMAVLLIVSCACLFESVRRQRAWLLLPFAFASAMAASIKPTLLPVGPVLLLLASFKLRRSALSLKSYWLYAIGGFLLATAIIVGFLVETRSMSAFIHTLTHVIPHYGDLRHKTLSEMAVRSLPLPVSIFVLLGIIVALLRKTPQNWEELCLLTFAAFGALSYFAQGKGFPQHRYTFLAFLLLWVCLQLSQVRLQRAKSVCIAIAAIGCCFLYLLPRELVRAKHFPNHDSYTDSLEGDLTQLGTGALQHQVQCFDIIDGCLTALYQLQIVQSTGATGDLLLFQPAQAPAVDAARAQYEALIQDHPPEVYVLSNVQFGVAPRSFNGKLATWPQFSNDLLTNYVLIQQRAFDKSQSVPTSQGQDSQDESYRIYIRRDSPLLRKARP